jgi:sugar phosphate isomerase/epimerase
LRSTRLTFVADEVSQDLPAVAAFARRAGLDGFELRSMFGRAFPELTPADAAEIRATAEGEGLRVHCCATPVFKCGREDAAAGREHRDVFRRALELARRLECGLLRIFAFRREGRRGLDGELAPRVADRIRPLAEEAAAAGATLGIENEASCLVAAPGEAALLLRHLGGPAGLVWDPANVLYLPDGEDAPRLAEAFRELAGRVVHVHVKDAVRTPEGPLPARAARVGEGDVGWAGQLAAVAGSGYPGLLSLETHWRERPLDAGQLDQPAGRGFSEGGEAASRQCLDRLRELWSSATRRES